MLQYVDIHYKCLQIAEKRALKNWYHSVVHNCVNKNTERGGILPEKEKQWPARPIFVSISFSFLLGAWMFEFLRSEERRNIRGAYTPPVFNAPNIPPGEYATKFRPKVDSAKLLFYIFLSSFFVWLGVHFWRT